ncbi:MAG: site-specific integrase [Clostridiales bacterium]|uniref:tyrosine-type recombinase/integrase n=1 Tax=Flavonifractor porci TaxID=3133422 RepID=UPI0030A2E617|nr:site-specific integrase [Clostridiales bacterium]
MKKRMITAELLGCFEQHLREEERSGATLEKYLREVRQFAAWLSGAQVSKAAVAQWKEYLLSCRYHPSTINGKLTALDRFLSCCGWQDCRVRHLKLQRQLFREDRRELTKYEYSRLVSTAERQKKDRLALLIETICATGIRVSEVKYITLEAVQQNKAEVFLKGKIRTILIPGKLCRKLQKYARKNKITSGELFLTRSGHSLSRKQIWAEMKALCKDAGVESSKVFPHNLRHLFARTFYNACRDVAKLADVLGHSAIETTRIYLVSTGAEHTRMLERLKLIR